MKPLYDARRLNQIGTFSQDRESDNGVDTSVERTLEKLKNNLMATPLSKCHCQNVDLYQRQKNRQPA
jgi:hypothetical protein